MTHSFTSTAATAVAVIAAGVATAGVAAALPPVPEGWESGIHADHPLVGTLWDMAADRAVEPDTLAERAGAADYVLLGETHDNPDHHRLQAWAVAALTAQTHRPAVVFEMIRADQAEALRDHLTESPRDAEGLGPAVAWAERGWPDWAIYEPIAEAALEAGLMLHPGDVSQDMQQAVSRDGLAALDDEERDRLGLDRPLPEGQQEALEAQLMAAHCDLVPEEALPRMAEVQRLRDAVMADSLIAAAETDGEGRAVLIAGREHVRGDRGVPWYLRARTDDPGILSVGLVQVSEAATAPSDYVLHTAEADGAPVFDYLWFTPRPHDRDRCAELREMMEGDDRM